MNPSIDTAKLREIGRAATAGPYLARQSTELDELGCWNVRHKDQNGTWQLAFFDCWNKNEENAAFFCAARNHWDALLDEIERLRVINRRACLDLADDDTDIRNQARRVLPEDQCESSDGYHLPIGDVVEKMADEIDRLRAEVKRLTDSPIRE